MRKDIPKDFLEQYRARSNEFEDALKGIIALLKLRLGQLASRTGIRGTLVESRIKRPSKIWENLTEAGFAVTEAFTRTEDLLGVRIVCNNLSDITPIVQMIRTCSSVLNALEIKDMVSSPSTTGYRAIHVRAEYVGGGGHSHSENRIPCEIQVRTLAQDTWARLSRADLYGKNVPPSALKIAQALSTQLSAIDEIAQLIRDDLNRCPAIAEEMVGSDPITPQRLALLYEQKFGEQIYEWSLIEWIRQLEEAEAKSIGDVEALLDDAKTRSFLDRISDRIRGFPLEDLEWAVYSATVAAEPSPLKGIRAVQKRIQDGWDEIVAVARREILSSMPESLEEFKEMLLNGSGPCEFLTELGGMGKCRRCGADIVKPERAAEAVLEYYGNPSTDLGLEELFADLPEAESVDYDGVCQYCGYQMSKND